MALKLLDKVKLALSNSINDDKGWFQQGKFTPGRQISSQINYQKQNSPINRALYTGLETASRPVVNSLANIGALGATGLGSLQMAFNKPQAAQKSFDKALAARQFAGTQGSFDQGTGWNTIKKGGLDAIQTALTGKGLKYTTPVNLGISGLLGGTMSKLSGGDFATGFGQGMGVTPQVMGFVGLTNPILSKALGGTKLAPLMASKAGSRITPAIANVAQGIGMDLARGTPTTAGSIGLDLLTGGLGGKTQFDMPSVKGFAMDKAKLDQIIQAEDMLKNPKNYVKDIYHATEKNKNLYIKQQSKEIQNKAAEVIDRLAAQYLPNKILSQTSGDSFKQIKALIDLNAQNGLTNVQMGIKSQSQPIKTGGDVKAGQYGYIHNLEKSPKPNVGDQFGQNIEPAGKYMNLTSSVERAIEQGKYFTDNGVKNMESGVVDFKNPLVIDNTGKFTKDWKIELSKRYGGKTGKELSNAIIKDGYDGIITTDNGVPSETVYFDKLLPNISPIKTGGDRTIKIKTGANLDNNQMGRTGNTLDQGKGQTQSISGKTPQGKPSPELPKQEQVVSRLSNPLGNQKSSSLTTSGNSTKNPTIKIRGFTESVQEDPKVTTGTKVKVIGEYTVKPTDELMGEAKALLTEGASIKDVKKVQNIDAKITATIQQAINLDKAGKHKEAAALFNNLSETGTELGRGVHAFTLLNQMSPEAISLSAAGKIKKYNETAKVKIPELTADQQKMISDNVKRIQSITDERMKNIELNKLQEKISNFIPSSFVDKLITTWKAGLLTSPRTTGRNIVGNTIMQGGEMTASKPAAFADWLMSQKTGQRTTVGSLQGTLSGAKTGVSSAVDVMKYGFDPSETITKFDIKKVTWGNNPVEQTLKKYTDFVFNSLSAQDKPFWNSSYARSLYDQAATTALNQGQKGNQKLIQSLVDNSTEQMKTIATNDANYATFKDKNMISNIAAGFKRAAGQKEWSKLPAEIMAPFTGVPSSIVGKTIDYSPIGLIKGIKDAGKVVTQNVPDLQRRAAQEIGRGTVGTAVFALGSYLMSKGLMTGQAKDDAERKQWELEGKQQNSIFVNGKWRSINSVGPQTLILLAGAKFDEEMKDPEGSMSKYGLTLVQDQLGQTFLSGVQQPLQAITDPNRYGKSYVGGQVASFVPNIVKDTSKALDPLARETDTGSFTGNIKTSVQSGIPIWRNQMTPKRDVLGNEIKQEPTGLGAYIDLFNSKTPISNNVVDELSRLNNAGYNATPSKLSSTQTIKGVKGKLNQQELDVLETKTGIAVSNGLDTLFKSNSYQKLDDEAKQKAVDDLVTKIRKQVRGTIDLTVMPDMGYTISADSPKGLGKVGLYGKSIITDPGQTIKAVIAGNPIRKVDGGAVILERKNGLGTLDAGDKTTQVDHIIPLSHGGTNDKENLQQLSNEEHKIKTEFNNYWLKEFQAGRISKKELQEKDKNWKNEIDSLPRATKEKLVAELSTDTTGSGKNYQIINDETGSISNIDLTFPEYPKLTGLTEADKALKSSYYSALSKIKTNATKLYNDGQLKAEEYNDILTKVSTSKSKSGSGKTKSKGGKITIKTGTTKFTPIKIKTYKPPTLKISKGIKKPSISNLKSRRTIKIKV